MSDRIAVMSQGKVEQIGFPEDIYERPPPGSSPASSARRTSSRPRSRPSGELLQIEAAPGDRLSSGRPRAERSAPATRRVHGPAREAPRRPRRRPVADRLCTIAGTVVDVVYQGVSTQLVVRTDAGTTLVVFARTVNG